MFRHYGKCVQNYVLSLTNNKVYKYDFLIQYVHVFKTVENITVFCVRSQIVKMVSIKPPVLGSFLTYDNTLKDLVLGFQTQIYSRAAFLQKK